VKWSSFGVPREHIVLVDGEASHSSSMSSNNLLVHFSFPQYYVQDWDSSFLTANGIDGDKSKHFIVLIISVTTVKGTKHTGFAAFSVFEMQSSITFISDPADICYEFLNLDTEHMDYRKAIAK
jgi:hypothetical protein